MDLDDMVAKAQATVAALKKITTGDSKSDIMYIFLPSGGYMPSLLSRSVAHFWGQPTYSCMY